MRDYTLIWSPEGRPLGVVTARDPAAARRKAPLPFRKFLGEIGVEEGARPGVERLQK